MAVLVASVPLSIRTGVGDEVSAGTSEGSGSVEDAAGIASEKEARVKIGIVSIPSIANPTSDWNRGLPDGESVFPCAESA